MKKKKSLPTFWEVPDELWKRMAPLILGLALLIRWSEPGMPQIRLATGAEISGSFAQSRDFFNSPGHCANNIYLLLYSCSVISHNRSDATRIVERKFSK